MLNSLMPKGAPFFELLLQQNQILCAVSKTLADYLESLESSDGPQEEIARLEDEADQIYLAITKELSQSFLTPIDREDILRICKAQEETVDVFNNLVNRLNILEFRDPRPTMVQLGRVMKEMVHLTRSMLTGMSEKRDSHNTREFLALRNVCEKMLRKGIVELYKLEESSPEAVLEVIKWTRAYDRLEKIINYIVVLAEAIEEAVVKNV